MVEFLLIGHDKFLLSNQLRLDLQARYLRQKHLSFASVCI